MSTTADHEVEAKFTITERALADYLRTTPTLTAAFALGSTTTVEHVDTYVDTPAYELLRAGCVVRIRHTPEGYRITVKSLLTAEDEHFTRRIELEEPLADSANPLDRGDWPAKIRTFLDPRLDNKRNLQPLFTLRQVRDKRLVSATGKSAVLTPSPFAELSIDDVQVYEQDQGLGRLLQPEELAQLPTLSAFQEVEAELLPDQAEANLRVLTQRLARRRGLHTSDKSKFARALELVNGHLRLDHDDVTNMQPTMHMADGCRLILRQQLAQLLLNEAGVRHSTDIEYIHDLRVAVRRARTALRLFGRYFRSKSLRRFGRVLRATGRRLGAVRDRDVALDKLAKFKASDKQSKGADPSPIASAWQTERDEAFGDLVTWLDSDEYSEFLVKFSRFCATPGKGIRPFHHHAAEAPSPFQVRHVLPSVLVRRFARVRTFEILFENEETIPAETLHQLRIQCKFLRYTLEFTKTLLGADGNQLIQSLKQLQEYLGDLNDAAVSQHLLCAVAKHVSTPAVAEYHAAQSAAIEQARNQVRDSLRTFLGAENRSRLARAVARI